MKNVILKYAVAVGMHHHGPRELEVEAKHVLKFEPNNPCDSNAVAIKDSNGRKVAYLACPSARRVSKIFLKKLHRGHVLCKPKSPAVVKRRNLVPQQQVSVCFKFEDESAEEVWEMLGEVGAIFTIL